MTANKLELTPCPFCGSTSIKMEKGIDDQPSYAFCRDCISIGPSALGEFDAAFMWNKREEFAPAIDYLINIRQVCRCLGLSRATIYRLIQKGKFPKPIHPSGTKASRWTIKDIENYQDQSLNNDSNIDTSTRL